MLWRAFVHEGQPLHDRGHFGHGLGDRLGAYQAFEVEHAILREIGLAARQKLQPSRAAGAIERIAVKVQNGRAWGDPFVWRMVKRSLPLGKATKT